MSRAVASLLSPTRSILAFRPASRRHVPFCRSQQTSAGKEDTAPAPPAPNAAPASASGPATAPRPVRPQGYPPRPQFVMGPDGEPIQLVRVENSGADSWAGVAGVDRGDAPTNTGLGRQALLVGGDVAVLLLFAAIGRNSHGEGLDILGILGTAWPFLVGYTSSNLIMGGYGADAQGHKVVPAAIQAVKSWALGVPLSLAIRGLSLGYMPPTPFIIVGTVATGVLFIGWRSALAALTPAPKKLTPQQQLATRKDKTGNPFEFIRLLWSLTKRW